MHNSFRLYVDDGPGSAAQAYVQVFRGDEFAFREAARTAGEVLVDEIALGRGAPSVAVAVEDLFGRRVGMVRATISVER